MIKSIYLKDGASIKETNPENIKKVFQEVPKFLWIDVKIEDEELTKEELSLLADVFNVHELSIEDCIFPQYHPKIEEFEDYVFIAMHGIISTFSMSAELKSNIYELDIIFGKSFIITLHTEEIPFIESIYEKAGIKPAVELKSQEILLHNIFQKIVMSYETVVDRINDKIDEIEDKALKNPSKELMHEIFSVKTVLLDIRKIVEPQKHIYIYFTREIPTFIPKKSVAYFRDIYFQYDRMSQSLSAFNQIIGSILEVYLSGVTLKLNEVIKFLTVIATIFMPAVLITSYYGMNVSFPEYRFFGQGNVWFFAFFVIVISTIALSFYLKNKKWF